MKPLSRKTTTCSLPMQPLERNMAIAAAPSACVDCMGCGGEWQGEGIPNSVCDACLGSRGKSLEAERDQLKAEVEALRKQAALAVLLPDLDEALESLEIHGRHSDQGYRELKDWYRKVALACAAMDSSKEAGQ